MIEAMCLACHGPIMPARRDGKPNSRALFCTDDGGTCRSAWHQAHKAHRPLPWRCYEARVMHAFRRRMELALHKLAQRLQAAGVRLGETG